MGNNHDYTRKWFEKSGRTNATDHNYGTVDPEIPKIGLCWNHQTVYNRLTSTFTFIEQAKNPSPFHWLLSTVAFISTRLWFDSNQKVQSELTDVPVNWFDRSKVTDWNGRFGMHLVRFDYSLMNLVHCEWWFERTLSPTAALSHWLTVFKLWFCAITVVNNVCIGWWIKVSGGVIRICTKWSLSWTIRMRWWRPMRPLTCNISATIAIQSSSRHDCSAESLPWWPSSPPSIPMFTGMPAEH